MNLFINKKLHTNSIILLFLSVPSSGKVYSTLNGIAQINFFLLNFLAILISTIMSVAVFLFFERAKNKIQLKFHANNDLYAHSLFGFFLLLSFFSYLYFFPMINAGLFGYSSDRDEALNIAARAIMNFDYPYHFKTIVSGPAHAAGLDGNPISPFPGAIILALPFVILGDGSLQNFFWIFVLYFFLTNKTGNALLSLFAVSVILFIPVDYYELISGGDLLANSVLIMLSYFYIFSINWGSLRSVIYLGLLTGLIFSSRLHFSLIAPIFFVAALSRGGIKMSLFYVFSTVISFACVTLPFIIYDFNGFSPLHAYRKIGKFDSVVPAFGIIVPLFSLLISIVFSIYIYRRSVTMVKSLLYISIVISLPILIPMFCSIFYLRQAGLPEYSWYGISWLPFLVCYACFSKSKFMTDFISK